MHLGSVIAFGFVAATAQAGAIVFDLNTNTGSAPVDYSITVTDNTPGYFHFAVEVASSSTNNADIVALYFDFSTAGANSGYSSADFSGSAITNVAFNSSNVQNGNIGQSFQFALAIGTPGAGNDFYDSFTFDMFVRNGLTLADLDMFGVRGTSVGVGSSQSNPGGESSKTFVEFDPNQTPMVPLPSGAGLTCAALLAAGARRRR